MATYTFSVYTFSSREIDQICRLTRYHMSGTRLPIDARTYTKQVLTYAVAWRLLDRRDDGRYVPSAARFHVCDDLPVEALWRLVQPMFKGQRSIGRSIARNRLWEDHLGIWAEGSRHHSAATLHEQMDVLCHLQSSHYCLVQLGGSIWQITQWHDAA